MKNTDNGNRVKVDPYYALARIYDQVMDHVDYAKWVQFILEIFEEHGLYPPASNKKTPILECACGTGTVALHLALRGYEVSAFDSSAAMVEVARSKVKSLRELMRTTLYI